VKQLIPKQKRLESVTLGDIDLLTNTHRMKDERTDRRKQQCKGNIGKTDKVSDIHECISLQLPANYRYLLHQLPVLILYVRTPERDLFTGSCTELRVIEGDRVPRGGPVKCALNLKPQTLKVDW